MNWTSNPKHVPKKVRDEVLDRDGHQCTAITRDGDRCREGVHLEAHHLGRWAPHEKTTPDMLVTLCHWHHNRITQQQAADARRANPTPREKRPGEKHPGLR